MVRFSWKEAYWRSLYDHRRTLEHNRTAITVIIAGVLSFGGFQSHEKHAASCESASPVTNAGKVHSTGAPQMPVDDNKQKIQSSFVSSKFLLTDSYRRRIFFKYERKLRMLSPPEKVFDYFASVKMPDGQTFMTSSDLMRAVVPVFPPSESSLVREGSLPGGNHLASCGVQHQSSLCYLTPMEMGLSFAETIDRDEFQKVMESMRARTRQHTRQYDGNRTGSIVEKSVENCGLIEYFFGKDGQKLLRHEDFERFLRDLHQEIIRLEFSHYDYLDQGTISAKDFGLSMVAAADTSYLNHYLDSVDALGKEGAFKGCRVTFEEFHNFSELRKHLQPLALAINSYGETYGLLTKADLQRAATQVCKVPLSDKIVDIVFHIFDVDKDGTLSTEEFLAVMERRERGVSDCLDSGIVSGVKCWWRCARNCQG